MANARGATLEWVAQGAALLALCALLIAGATLFFPWQFRRKLERDDAIEEFAFCWI